MSRRPIPRCGRERLYGAEIGVGGNGGGVEWSATGFYNRLDDAVINATVRHGPFTDPVEGVIPAGGTLFQRRNVDHINAWGLEASARRDWGRLGARLAADYTYAQVDGGAAAPALTGLRPAETPRISVTGGLSWRPVDRLTLLAEARYDGARFDDDLNTRRLAPGGTADLRADVRVTRAVSVFAARREPVRRRDPDRAHGGQYHQLRRAPTDPRRRDGEALMAWSKRYDEVEPSRINRWLAHNGRLFPARGRGPDRARTSSSSTAHASRTPGARSSRARPSSSPTMSRLDRAPSPRC